MYRFYMESAEGVYSELICLTMKEAKYIYKAAIRACNFNSYKRVGYEEV